MVRVESATRIRPVFDPATDTRSFNIVVSDYSMAVLGPRISALVAREAPNIRLGLRPQHADPSRLLDRGEADMLIVPDYLGVSEHASEILFEDELVVLVAEDGPHGAGPMTRDRFEAAPQVLMEPLTGQESYSAVAIRKAGIVPRVVMSSYLFSAIPDLIRGTDRIGLIQRRLAEIAVAHGGLALHPAPFEVAPLRQSIRWHAHRSRDPGLIWLRDCFKACAAEALETPG